MPTVSMDAARLTDWNSFHDEFERVFGFPGFYGRNMNAWIDCMGYLDAPEAEMSTIHGSATDIVVLHLDNVDALPDEIYDAIVECAAFVNWRRTRKGDPAILALSFYRFLPLQRAATR